MKKFDRKKHPKESEFDAISVHMQIRKNKLVDLDSVCRLFEGTNWRELFTNDRNTSVHGNEIVCTFRVWFSDKKPGIKIVWNLSTGRYHKLEKQDVTEDGRPLYGPEKL